MRETAKINAKKGLLLVQLSIAFNHFLTESTKGFLKTINLSAMHN